MPRDTTALLEAPPDLTTSTEAGLVWLLRHPEAWPDGFEWDYSDCEACAMGLAAEVWCRSLKEDDDANVYAYLDLMKRLFPRLMSNIGRIFINLDTVFRVRTEHITPEHVAIAIENVLILNKK
jgi:hypothetical protein